MSRILIATWNFPGHIFPQIALAHALRQRGHEPAFYTGKKAARLLETEGFLHFPFEALDEEHVHNTVLSPERGSMGWAGLARFQKTLNNWLLGTIEGQVTDLQRIIREWNPACIASDPTLWGPILILQEKLGIPVIVSSFVPACIIPGPDAPPFGLGLPRPSTPGRKLLAGVVRRGQDLFAGAFRNRANAIRGEHGLAALPYSVGAHTATAQLYLVPCSPGFDYSRRDLPANVAYVGPGLWNAPRFESEDWLNRIPRDRPWIHVTEGTVHTGDPFLLRNAAIGCASMNAWLVMTTGSDRDPARMGIPQDATNVVVGKWAAHQTLLPKVDCIVTTGGAGTVLAALSAGVPLVIVPTEWDKPEIARRVEEAGAGITIQPRSCTPNKLRQAIDKLLQNPSFRERARALSIEFARMGGPARSAELIEQVVKEHVGARESSSYGSSNGV